MQTPQYRLTEEVIRQAVEVHFKQGARDWQISFSNPTAGPWKMIRIGKYRGGQDLRYAKEENRPDLILFAPAAGVFLILEAKDGIQKLLASQTLQGQVSYKQLITSMNVFEKEIQRIDQILGDAALSDQVFADIPRPSEITIVPGYIFPASGRAFNVQRRKLYEIHSLLSKYGERTDPRLEGCVSFIVKRTILDELTVQHSFYNLDESLCQFLYDTFPPSITPFEDSNQS